MRKKWHIRSRVLGSLLTLTSAMLLVVALAFNLSVQGYIRAQVSTYLGNELARAEADRMGAGREPNVGPRSEGHTARPVGSQDSAILLDKDGNLLDIISGSETTAGQIAAYCRNLGISNGIQNAITTIDGNTYAMTAVPDPMDSNNFLLVYVDITSTMELTQKINLVMVIVILAAILISVLVSRRFAKSLAEPVQSLCDFAGEIGKGNLTTRESARCLLPRPRATNYPALSWWTTTRLSSPTVCPFWRRPYRTSRLRVLPSRSWRSNTRK